MNDISKDEALGFGELVRNFEERANGKELAIPEQDTFFATIERLASRPDVDVEKIKQFMDMNERVLDRNAKQAFNESMTRAQSKIDLVVATSENLQTKSKYATLKKILIDIKPIYTAEGFSLMFYEGDTERENQKKICVDIMHSQGHTESRHGYFTIQTTGIAGKAMMTQIHGEGSAIQYGRRYLTCMIFNVPVGEDDNGVAAGGIEYITEEQVKIIELLAEETNKDVLKWRKVESIDKILAKDFKTVEAGLRAAVKKQREPGE